MPHRRNAYAGMVDGLPAGGFGELRSAVAARECRGLVGFGASGEAAEAWKPDPRCP